MKNYALLILFLAFLLLGWEGVKSYTGTCNMTQSAPCRFFNQLLGTECYKLRPVAYPGYQYSCQKSYAGS